MNLAPLIDQPNGFQVNEWPYDEAGFLFGPRTGCYRENHIVIF